MDAWLRAELARIPTEQDLQQPANAEWIANAFDGRLRKYLDILNAHTTGLWLCVAEVIKKGGGKVQSDYLAHGIRTDTNGLEPRINKHIDRLTAGLPATEDDAKAQMREYLDMIAPGGEVFVPVGPGNITEAAPLVERTRATAEAGAAGALFYNYGLMREGGARLRRRSNEECPARGCGSGVAARLRFFRHVQVQQEPVALPDAFEDLDLVDVHVMAVDENGHARRLNRHAARRREFLACFHSLGLCVSHPFLSFQYPLSMIGPAPADRLPRPPRSGPQ